MPHPQQSLSDLVDVARFALVAAFLEDAFSLAFCLFFAIQSLLLFGNCSICKKGRLYTGCGFTIFNKSAIEKQAQDFVGFIVDVRPVHCGRINFLDADMGKAGKADICDCLVNKRAMKGFGSVQIVTKRQ